MAKKKLANRHIIYCLLCKKPQETISVHLARVCMKKKSEEEIQEETQRAKDSMKKWILKARNWDYHELCSFIPNKDKRLAFVEKLQNKGFFINNLSNEADLVSDPEPVLEQPSAIAPATEALQASTSEAQTRTTDKDPTWQKPTFSGQASVRLNMQKMGLYEKFPNESSLLVKFKTYLTDTLSVPNNQQEVDNVSRMLRYMQPSGDEISLDFLLKFEETNSFIKLLKKANMGPSTILNYVKNMIRFVMFLKTYLHFETPQTPEQIQNFQSYIDLLNIIRKPLSKENSRLGCKVKHDRFVDGMRTLSDCHKVMKVAKPYMLNILGNTLTNDYVSSEDRTIYRYYCEAILILNHYQRPGVAEGFKVSEWLKKHKKDDRISFGVSKHKTANTQLANFALTMEEYAFFEAYYMHMRSDCVKDSGEENDRFFINTRGRPIKSATNDLNRLHEHFKLPKVTSQEIRRVLETEVNNRCTDEQKKEVASYLAHSTPVADIHYRMRQPTTVARTSILISTLEGSSESSSNDDRTKSTKRTRETDEDEGHEDIAQFLKTFPVTLSGPPPTKKQRAETGFSDKRILYDKWRKLQYDLRESHLMSLCTRRPPTAKVVLKNIKKEGWKANYPCPEDIVLKWKPPQQAAVERDPRLLKMVQKQTWSGLCIKTFSAEKGNGLVATKMFPKGSILCDYHGKVISAAEGRKMQENIQDEMGYLFFFSSGSQRFCIDAQTFPCECHPDMETFGRTINHSSKNPNVQPLHCLMQFPEDEKHIILFKALKDIKVNDEIRFNYGVNRKSFRGEGLDLVWLDE